MNLGRILTAVLLFKGLMIEWVIVRGFRENTGKPAPDVWTESTYQVHYTIFMIWWSFFIFALKNSSNYRPLKITKLAKWIRNTWKSLYVFSWQKVWQFWLVLMMSICTGFSEDHRKRKRCDAQFPFTSLPGTCSQVKFF